MKILKISSLIFAISVVALFGYANLRKLSVVEKLRPVQLISFDISGEITFSRPNATRKKTQLSRWCHGVFVE